MAFLIFPEKTGQHTGCRPVINLKCGDFIEFYPFWGEFHTLSLLRNILNIVFTEATWASPLGL